MPKLTFSLDDDTVRALRKAAENRGKPQSLIVREAIAMYTTREAVLPPAERQRLMGVLRRIRTRPPTRTPAEVDRELQDVRQSRRTGWNRTQK